MEDCSPKILHKLQQVFPDTTSYHVDASIVQANAVGYKLELIPSRQKVFYKVVEASTYVATKKDWPDLRRTLLYARTEARLYRAILPDLQRRGFDAVPRIHLAECHLERWIDESECATQACSPEMARIDIQKDLAEPQNKGGVLIMDCVSDDLYFQDSPLTIDQCRQCLVAVAKLHAAAWQDQALLKRAETILSKASFHLATRNPKELAGIVDAWDGFYQAFQKPFEEECNLVWTDRLRDMGRRTLAVAQLVSDVVSPKPSDPYATIIHGDYKSMNVFLPRDSKTHSALLVDWASCGVGVGMSDLAMHIHHALPPRLLEDGVEESLVKYYWQQLCDLTKPVDYPWELAWKHYQYAVVDYFRFFLARMWKGASPESLRRKKDNKNVSLINRDISAACAFLVVADEFLARIESDLHVTTLPTDQPAENSRPMMEDKQSNVLSDYRGG